MATDPIGNVFCRGAIALGSGCMRCGRCAVQLAEKVRALEAAALASAPAAGPVEQPAGWKFNRGVLDEIVINGPIGGCVVQPKAAVPRTIPEEILHALATDLLATPTAPIAQPAPQAGAAEPTRQYFYKNNKCESYNSSKSSCTCWHDEGTGPFAEGRSGLTWREKPTEQPSQDAEDAARYRWLREQHWNEADFCVVRDPRRAVRLGHDCPSLERLDAAIDAARAAQAQGESTGGTPHG